MRTIGMSDYTVGEDCFTELPAALAEYGATKVAIIGGKRALAAALPGIEAALEGTDVEILETRVYGTNSTRANIAKVVNSPACQQADVLIACGGGKALDTVKTAAIELKKIVFTVPTICSNCSAATAIAVVYNDDGSLEGYSYPNRPAHIFINPKIIAEAPAEYFWAGVGDALSMQPVVEYATSAGDLEHTAGLAAALLQMRERAMQVRGGLVVHGDHVGTGIGVPIDGLVGVRHHEVRVGRYIGGALDGLEDVNAKGEVAGKVAVHDVEVHKVGTGDLVEFALEVGHVGRKDRRSDFDGTHGRSLSALVGESVELLRRDAIGKNLERPIQSNTVVERLLHGKGERNVYAQ